MEEAAPAAAKRKQDKPAEEEVRPWGALGLVVLMCGLVQWGRGREEGGTVLQVPAEYTCSLTAQDKP